jgi:hypothetical protein
MVVKELVVEEDPSLWEQVSQAGERPQHGCACYSTSHPLSLSRLCILAQRVHPGGSPSETTHARGEGWRGPTGERLRALPTRHRVSSVQQVRPPHPPPQRCSSICFFFVVGGLLVLSVPHGCVTCNPGAISRALAAAWWREACLFQTSCPR